MPSLKDDNSIQATVWRGYTKNGAFNLQNLKQADFLVGSSRTNTKLNYTLPTVIGIRNGIPYGQDQLDMELHKRQLNPYPTAKSPFLSKNLEDIAPRHYNVNPLGGTAGELTNLSSMGGNPLAIALDDGTALQQRVHNESMRTDPRNPLSAEFAWRAYMNQQEHPEKGPLADAQRLQLADGEEEESVIKSRVAKGYSETQRLNESDHNELKRLLEHQRDLDAGDILDIKGLFKTSFLPTEANSSNFMEHISKYYRDHIKLGAAPPGKGVESSNGKGKRKRKSYGENEDGNDLSYPSIYPTDIDNPFSSTKSLRSSSFSKKSFKKSSPDRQVLVEQQSLGGQTLSPAKKRAATPLTPSLRSKRYTNRNLQRQLADTESVIHFN